MFRIDYFTNEVKEVEFADDVVYEISQDTLGHIRMITHIDEDGDEHEFTDDEFVDMVNSGFKF